MPHRVYVWDRFVRLFHWTLVAAFATAYLSGEDQNWLHFYAGYLVCLLLASRLVWGFVGSRHARFGAFLTAPRAALGYLASLVRGPTRHYLGHNPAGGWMVVVLLASLTLTVGSGLRAYGLEGHGPLAVARLPKPDLQTMSEHEILTLRAARKARHDQEEFWEEFHELGANGTLLLIGLHVLGVLVSSLRHRENLARAMLTGYKQPPPAEPAARR